MTNVLIWKGIAREGNPFLADIAGAPFLVVIKVVGVLLAALILRDVYRRFPRLAFWTSFAFLGIYTVVVIWNTTLLVLGKQA